MLSSSLSFKSRLSHLSFKCFRNAHRNKPKLFDFHHGNPNHIPHPKSKPKVSFERKLLNWPPDCPPTFGFNYPQLLKKIEKTEIDKYLNQPKFSKEMVRLGDKVRIENYLSITSGVFNTIDGVVLGTKRTEKLSFSFVIIARIEGEMVCIEFPFFSPLLKSVRVTKKADTFKEGQDKIFYLNKIRNIGKRVSLLLKGTRQSMNMNKRQKQKLDKEFKERMVQIEQESADEFEGLDI